MKINLINLVPAWPILVVTAMTSSSPVWAQSLSPEKTHSSQTISHLQSPIDFVTHWLKNFKGDGRTNAENQVGNGTYALNDPDFGGDGKPGNSKAQGSRGNCPQINLPLTALIPTTNLGKTVDGRPTFWFYVPYNAESVNRAELMILDDTQKPFLSKPLSILLSNTPGLVSVTLPDTEPALEIDQDYHWYFELECSPSNPSTNPRVDGWVQRVAPIPGIRPDDYISYAEHGIWYNTLNPLARMRQQDQDNPTLQQDWVELLNAVELADLMGVNGANCCEAVDSADGI